MVRVLALNWKERYPGDRLALTYCVELGIARRSAPYELAWTWCTLAYRENGDNMTHCYLTLAPKYGGISGA